MVLNYPFVYSIFSWCAKGIVIFLNSEFADAVLSIDCVECVLL